MAYLYTRQIIIDLGPQNKESFYDEEIYSDSYPSLNMEHLQNPITIHQYAVCDEECDPFDDLVYSQMIINIPGKEQVSLDPWSKADWVSDKLEAYLEDVASDIHPVILTALGGSETSDFANEIETYSDEVGWRCELVRSGGGSQVALDEDELESYNLDRFYGIYIIHKVGEIDDSMLKDIPDVEIDSSWTEEEKEDIGYMPGVDLDFEEDGLTLRERLLAGEICEDYLDDYEIFGYVTATTDSGEDEDDFEEDEE